jgi:hypothetical protein
MSDIFLSYSRKDKTVAEKFAKLFESKGWSVFWDKQIPPGKSFDQFIKERLDASRCIIVLWSDASVASDWVKEEASRGIRQSKLVPVLIEKIDPPLGFGRIEAAELYNWTRGAEDPDQQAELENLLQAITLMLEPSVDNDAAVLNMPTPKNVSPAAVPVQPPRPSADTPLPFKQHTPHRKQAAFVAGTLAAVGAVAAVATSMLMENKPELKVEPPKEQIVPPTEQTNQTQNNNNGGEHPTSIKQNETSSANPTQGGDRSSPETSNPDNSTKNDKIPGSEQPPQPAPSDHSETNSTTIGTISGKPGWKNLRSGPGTRYGVVKEIKTGETVEVLGSSTDVGGYQWFRVRTSDGVEAWIAAQLIKIP